MITIYCLVDPRTNSPFYIGATKVKLKNRLSAHIHEAAVFRTNNYAMPFTAYKKHFLIQELTKLNIKPKIEWLYTCTINNVDHYEPFFYNVLISQGFELFNFPHNFNYSKYKKVSYYNYNKNS